MYLADEKMEIEKNERIMKDVESKIIEFAHDVLINKISTQDIFVDMTMGNGNDTLFLCKIAKFVYAFDIQQIALDNTKKKLIDNDLSNYSLILDTHENIDLYIKESVKGFIYNLGYLPTGDKNITTLYTSTINSLKKALLLLKEKGIIVLVVYEGHENGKIESIKLNEFLISLPQKEYDVITYRFINQINNPPYVVVIERK